MKLVEDFLRRNINTNKNNIYFIYVTDVLLLEWSFHAHSAQ